MRERRQRDAWLSQVDFSLAPFTIAWEVTRACVFACVHCRADAQVRRSPLELSTDEGFALIDRLTAFGSPILVFTGGDPMMRKDLFDLIEYADHAGLRCSLTPTATALPTVARLRRAQQAGVRRIALSLDAPTAEVHDAFRQVPGSWDRTMAILRNAHDIGLSTQVNTTVTTHNVDALPRMVEFVKEVGAVQWSVFFLVPMGRGQELSMISPEQHERTLEWLHDLSLAGDFDVKATAAPMYRRIAAQRRTAGPGHPVAGAGFALPDGLDRPAQGVNDGRGFLFISHTGDITPSGFLPIVTGNVRRDDVVDVYRNHDLFRALRDPGALTGKCGACEFREVCGGQRGRAYAVTGDPLASDPACAYVPRGAAAS
ncbi:MAG TPA: TIGR04053 family radical SAM/SPASM domain-containing protein [Nocardioides sp.]|nr:TIGR04053 family radical SAM/SPASM domain-containing protein [Nocardioides sp.]